ncbi:CLUMA_CG006850, isoform A [Clunio marinus]|uniref:CLUMA_CG006850, isoform A n=1 Tax=Clunio marinus TaxID=568069 RepID=A0A1J1HZC5_9DIPT|nr:CLUMA_CG006850, isoform A [Clunio marinus]
MITVTVVWVLSQESLTVKNIALDSNEIFINFNVFPADSSNEFYSHLPVYLSKLMDAAIQLHHQ